MENTLIEVKTGKNGVQTVSARLLHEKLEVNHRFNEWFAALLKYGFKENEDFTRVQTCTVVNNGAKRTIIDYFITIDMAKEICMLQRSEIGKKFRQYFIKCEKALIEHTELRNKSKTVRNNFTNTLKEHGYKNPYEYIQTTKQMKDTLGITSHSFVYKKSMRQLSIEWAVKIAKQLAEPLDDLFFRDFAREA